MSEKFRRAMKGELLTLVAVSLLLLGGGGVNGYGVVELKHGNGTVLCPPLSRTGRADPGCVWRKINQVAKEEGYDSDK
jgi:hypothetical protein